MKITGVVLILIGILALAYQGFSFNETHQDAKLGPVQIQHTETKTVPIPPLVGGGMVIAGAVVLALGFRRNM